MSHENLITVDQSGRDDESDDDDDDFQNFHSDDTDDHDHDDGDDDEDDDDDGYYDDDDHHGNYNNRYTGEHIFEYIISINSYEIIVFFICYRKQRRTRTTWYESTAA